ncbi:MAG: N-acetylmuramoyl-L-alanine amidase [Mariprofundales bacterium]|nr:N-acetylmuramoyl-L-alanine amidase [Mariprofundales bacterium]
MNHRTLKWLLGILFGLFPLLAWGSPTTVNRIHLWNTPGHTRIVFALTHAPSYKIFRLHQPERVVIDIKHARLTASIPKFPNASRARVHAIRVGRRKAGGLRIVLDVGNKVTVRNAVLKPYHHKPYQLVINLSQPTKKTASIKKHRIILQPHHKITIAVDAGHGGVDPGATGRDGLQEKWVTLAIAKDLTSQLNQIAGIHAFLTRHGDYYVPLKERVRIARRHHADIMISIHADAVRNRRVKGASVYTLSRRGATPDKVAAALASKENAADAVAGIIRSSQSNDPMVSSILGDMARTDSLNSSLILAEQIIHQIGRVAPVKYDRPKRARFVVLGAMEIPSVLVETDYISNPSRERLFKNRHHQRVLARAIADGSIAFLQRMGQLKARASLGTRKKAKR